MPIDAARHVDAAPAAAIDGSSSRTILAPYKRACGARAAVTTPACRRPNAINRTEVVFLYRCLFSLSFQLDSYPTFSSHHSCDVVKTQIARETAHFHTLFTHLGPSLLSPPHMRHAAARYASNMTVLRAWGMHVAALTVTISRPFTET